MVGAKKKNTSFRASIVVLIVALVFSGIGLAGFTHFAKEYEQARREREETINTYIKSNYAFGFVRATTMMHYDRNYRERMGRYLDYQSYDSTRYISFFYIPLKYYEKMTGNTLEYEMVIEYLSVEYEPDGSLRLYNNGLHPEIEAYVDWIWYRRAAMYFTGEDKKISDDYEFLQNHSTGYLIELERYTLALRSIYYSYYYDHREEGFDGIYFGELSPQMYDELIKKEADPSYELDLLSLLQR
jgi:hypothetical protein